jgi:hypothetical protein
VYNLSSHWDVQIQFIRGEAHHHLRFEQDSEKLTGVYDSQYSQQPLRGAVKDSAVQMQTAIPHEGQSVRYLLDRTISGDEIQGTLNLGEYWQATWKARKREQSS